MIAPTAAVAPYLRTLTVIQYNRVGSSALTVIQVEKIEDVPVVAFQFLGSEFGVYVVLPEEQPTGGPLLSNLWPAVSGLLVLIGCRSFWFCGDGADAWETASDAAIISLSDAAYSRPDLYGIEPFRTGKFTVATASTTFDTVLLFGTMETGISEHGEYGNHLVLVFTDEDRLRVLEVIEQNVA